MAKQKTGVKVMVILIIVVLLFSVIGIVAVYLNTPTQQYYVPEPTYQAPVDVQPAPVPEDNSADDDTMANDTEYEIIVDQPEQPTEDTDTESENEVTGDGAEAELIVETDTVVE